MKRTDVVERLMHFDLSRQESQIYICLWEHGTLTGYEASKITGISRSNVYGSLSSLVDKGAAMVAEGASLLYTAVDPQEFLDNKMKHLKEDRQYILEALPEQKQELEGYFTIQGCNNIRDKVCSMIENCNMRLYFAAEGDILQSFEEAIRKARDRNLKIVIMSDRDFSHISTKFYQDSPQRGQIRLITDSAYVLTGELTGGALDTCLYSGQKNLVNVMKEALRNKIKLLELEETKKGGRL